MLAVRIRDDRHELVKRFTQEFGALTSARALNDCLFSCLRDFFLSSDWNGLDLHQGILESIPRPRTTIHKTLIKTCCLIGQEHLSRACVSSQPILESIPGCCVRDRINIFSTQKNKTWRGHGKLLSFKEELLTFSEKILSVNGIIPRFFTVFHRKNKSFLLT